MSEKTTTHVDTPLGPSTQRALDAVRDLHAAGQIATREAVAELTGDRLSVVDDRLRVLADDKFIRRLARGAYMPMEQHPPPRVISKTLLPDGTVKYEIGDEVLTLTPAEDRALASLSAGAATQAAAIQTGMATAELVDDLRAKHRVVDTIIIGNMQRQLRKQEQEIKRLLAANEEKKMAQISLIPLE